MPKYFNNLWEKLNSLNEDYLLEMANVTGKYMKIEDIDFSFYFSKKNSGHGIRAKINWNRESMTGDKEGYMELHGEYRYSQSPKLKFYPDSQSIKTARYFFKRYKVLFAAVWESVLDADTLAEYFKNRISWEELKESFEIKDKELKEVMLACQNLKDLEYAVRKNNIFNMND